MAHFEYEPWRKGKINKESHFPETVFSSKQRQQQIFSKNNKPASMCCNSQLGKIGEIALSLQRELQGPGERTACLDTPKPLKTPKPLAYR